jgi:four helix bundle protein
MSSYRDLRAWQHAKRLSIEVGKAVRQFPEEERMALADQMRRAAYSVALNIAEGAARKGSKEFRRFLDMARGSLSELQSALEISDEMGYLPDGEFERLDAIATETAKTLWGLLRKITDSMKRRPIS